MNCYHSPGCRHQAPRGYGLTELATNLLRLGYSAAWGGARAGRALLERAIWMDHSPGCPRGGCGRDCCHIECLPPVYAGCRRHDCGGY
ncbi:MAG TPA: hypothetical protein VMH28_14450 [Candidatus Acidoferrales bacterium]|nr:hypothetical protein [Candidatus Acidoferrales bacterium]